MTFYALFSKPERGPEAIAALKQRFFWTAFLFTPVWALVHGAFAFLVLWALVCAAAVFGAPVIGVEAVAALYVLFALWSGFAAPQIAGRSLERRGWLAHGLLAAPDRQAAETAWLRWHYGARP